MIIGASRITFILDKQMPGKRFPRYRPFVGKHYTTVDISHERDSDSVALQRYPT